jgi:hypothetical protein
MGKALAMQNVSEKNDSQDQRFMTPVALYDSGGGKKSVFYPIAFTHWILYNMNME